MYLVFSHVFPSLCVVLLPQRVLLLSSSLLSTDLLPIYNMYPNVRFDEWKKGFQPSYVIIRLFFFDLLFFSIAVIFLPSLWKEIKHSSFERWEMKGVWWRNFWAKQQQHHAEWWLVDVKGCGQYDVHQFQTYCFRILLTTMELRNFFIKGLACHGIFHRFDEDFSDIAMKLLNVTTVDHVLQ